MVQIKIYQLVIPFVSIDFFFPTIEDATSDWSTKFLLLFCFFVFSFLQFPSFSSNVWNSIFFQHLILKNDAKFKEFWFFTYHNQLPSFVSLLLGVNEPDTALRYHIFSTFFDEKLAVASDFENLGPFEVLFWTQIHTFYDYINLIIFNFLLTHSKQRNKNF